MYAMRPVDQAVVIILFHPAVTNAILRFIFIPCCVPHLRPDRSMLQINGVEKFYKQCSFSAKKTPHRGFNFLQKDEISQKSGCFFKSPAYENIVWTSTIYRIVPEAMEISMLRFHRKVTVTTTIAAASGIPKVPPEENETFRRQ